MILEHNKRYVTESGYVVHIVKDGDYFFATIKSSPGTACSGVSPEKYDKDLRRKECSGKGYGWEYHSCGKLAHHHLIKLDIVRELQSSDRLETVDGFLKLVSLTSEPSIKKEETTMKKETAIAIASATAKFVGNTAFKAANYFAIEPAMNIGRPIVRSIRYAMFVGGLGLMAYGWNHPEEAKSAVAKCLPSISFSVERPEILK